LLVLFKTTGRKIDWSLIGSLVGLTKAFLIGLLILMFVGELTHLYSSNSDAIIYMLTGPYSWIFWTFQIFLGMAIPLFLLFYSKTKTSPAGIIISSILVVIGIFVKRYYLVIPGAAYPQQYYPGKIEGVYGAVGQFPLTLTELGMSIGMFAFLALIFILGLKYLEVLPPKPPPEQIKAPAEGTTPAAGTPATQ
jgi:molybdopterin-containing oxidoreductase family membrane subunit